MTDTGRLTPNTKTMIAYVLNIDAAGNNITSRVGLRQSDNTGLGPTVFNIPMSGVNSYADIRAALPALVNTLCTDNDLDVPSSFIWLTENVNFTPGAHIANAPADAVTNYNVVTTLLGSVTGAVNTANAKQNDIATKVNAIIAVLQENGLLLAS